MSSAIYKEASSYFQQTDSNVDKKVTMITPLVEKYYNPWINSANALAADFGKIRAMHEKSATVQRDDVTHLLYGYMVFYGYRMKFIQEAGGTILLTTTAVQKQVLDDYRAVETALNWKDATLTQESVSMLQDLFLTNGASIKNLPAVKNDLSGKEPSSSPKSENGPVDPTQGASENNSPAGGKVVPGPQLSSQSKNGGESDDTTAEDKNLSATKPSSPTKNGSEPGDPTHVMYLYYAFKRDVEKNRPLGKMVDDLSDWVKDDAKVKAAEKAVEKFADRFQDGIDQLFTAWGQ